MNDNAHGNLLVQYSGQGKSTVYQTIGNILRGVAVIIQPTLALSADQKSEIDFAKITDYAIVGIQCDSIKSTLAFELLEKTLLNVDDSTTANIFLFVSPETLLKDQWIKLLMKLISNKVMRLLVVDEVHLFVEFGMSFRKSICDLKKVLFDQLWKDKLQIKLSVPIIFMSTTFNVEYMKYLKLMTGISINDDNIHWGA